MNRLPAGLQRLVAEIHVTAGFQQLEMQGFLQSIDIVSVESESRLPSAPPRMNTFMAVDHFLSA